MSQPIQYRLSTRNLHAKVGPFGHNSLIIGAVFTVIGVITAAATQIWFLVVVGPLLWLIAIARLWARNRVSTGVRELGTMTIGPDGLHVANPQGLANVASWRDIETIGFVGGKDTLCFGSRSRLGPGWKQTRAGLPVYEVLSMMFIEADPAHVQQTLQYWAGGRYRGSGLRPEALQP